jgi:hypothetical protein
MPTKIRSIMVALVLLPFQSQSAVSQTLNSNNVPAELRRTVSDHDVQKGQTLSLRLEFKNVGRDDFFVPKWLVSITNGTAFVSFGIRRFEGLQV